MLFRELSLFEIAVLATMLAPTDAALGKAVVTNKSVPARIREGLNIESGLNDGLAFPFVVFFAALAEGGTHAGLPDRLLVFIAMQAGIGLGVGLATGALGGVAGPVVGFGRWRNALAVVSHHEEDQRFVARVRKENCPRLRKSCPTRGCALTCLS